MNTLERCARIFCRKQCALQECGKQAENCRYPNLYEAECRIVVEALMEPDEALKDKLIALGIDRAAWQAALRSVLGGEG